jgi:hypothetical protein
MLDDMQILNPLEYGRWDDLPAPNGRFNFFHSSHWARVICETYRYLPVYFTVLNGNSLDTLVPMMEVRSILTGARGVSLPFTDYCRPILGNGIELDHVLDYIGRYGRKHGWRSVQVRGGRCGGPASEHFYVHGLDLAPDPDEIFSRLDGSRKRNIKKAVREGVEVGKHGDEKAVARYYRLHCKTRKRQGVPPQPYRFFENIHRHILSRDLGCIMLASYKGRDIAGCVFFNFRDTAFYKFGASDHLFQYLRPSDLVMWEAIKWFAGRGCRSLCFGRTAPGNQGLRRYKSAWATEEQKINYYKYDLRRNRFIKQPTGVAPGHRRLLRSAPLCASRLVGRLLYRHAG